MHGNPLHIQSCWASLPILTYLMQATTENVECRRMSGAMTNLVFRCDYKGHPNGMGTMPACFAAGSAPKYIDSVIVRIEGLPSYDRAMELKCFKTGVEEPAPSEHAQGCRECSNTHPTRENDGLPPQDGRPSLDENKHSWRQWLYMRSCQVKALSKP
eukprot:1157350-Pelagomonas_calceolata.AAC.1